MRSAIVAILAVALLGDADAVKLKIVNLHFKDYTETITLSEENIAKTCVLPNAGEPYSQTYNGIITHRNIIWQVIVLGRYENDAIVFIIASVVAHNDPIITKSLSIVWNGKEWENDETPDHKKITEFVKKLFTDEEYQKLFNCTFNNQKQIRDGNSL